MNICGHICLALIFFSLYSLFIVGPFSVVPFLESVSKEDNDVSKITRGSSLSLNDTSPYWLSPSGNIAFGFYQLPWSPGQYVVGVWFPKSSGKTLIWTAKHKDLIPAHKPSSILFTDEGKLVLQILPDNKKTPLLPDAAEPASYAKLHDNGNLVLYGTDSQNVWESFDYPTDTILGGQKLRLGVDHLISNSGEYKLSIEKTDGALIISKIYDEFVARIHTAKYLGGPATLNLDTTGRLYLVNSDSSIIETIYDDKNQQRKLEEEDRTSSDVKKDYIYRATLDSKGEFALFKERFDGNCGDNLVQLWSSSSWSSYLRSEKFINIILFFSIVVFPITIMMILIVKFTERYVK